eukprot:CAMPEP_0119494214 /NCGR_PEP_ID=MMETSP1344-20130328/18232_1 /TAXON_ID=236787 /ORGANISM="Florenciella parvula, Strain CCMP2471" /LENGTH=85 /DNA_ID=CAMNT_0007529701 /DNA_START=302 /DNA_END=555 /DNA_ORIENTATION=-
MRRLESGSRPSYHPTVSAIHTIAPPSALTQQPSDHTTAPSMATRPAELTQPWRAPASAARLLDTHAVLSLFSPSPPPSPSIAFHR